MVITSSFGLFSTDARSGARRADRWVKKRKASVGRTFKDCDPDGLVDAVVERFLVGPLERHANATRNKAQRRALWKGVEAQVRRRLGVSAAEIAIAKRLHASSRLGGVPVFNAEDDRPKGARWRYHAHLGADIFDTFFGDAGSLHVWTDGKHALLQGDSA